ncbi:putative non-structural maintenance of chromosomes element 1 homolog [[Candida] railenensis]|uniref:Non-structural maintenance of chromosomes element 1 homolog n=1 Tax=[Candida] railenensis TaxID=45579 RepID=A0A9P0VZF7_9ASCO|nr:putative non-structural maintenance of chromosomes element 1 homolog [[Candida] railenensis]
MSYSSRMDVYSPTHITLLTYIRSASSCSQSQLLKVLAKIIRAIEPEVTTASQSPVEPTITKEVLDGYISAINTKVNPTGFKIAKYRDQVSGTIYYIFISTVSDAITKSNTSYTPPEIDSIKKVIDDIIDQDSFVYSLGYVNSSQRVGQTLNKTARESNMFLTKLIDDGWFELTEEDRIVLSGRSICELKHYLVERYGLYGEDVEKGKLFVCQQCKELVTIGFKCKENSCAVSFHAKCLDFYNRLHDSPRCPGNCNFEWTEAGRRLGVLPETLK